MGKLLQKVRNIKKISIQAAFPCQAIEIEGEGRRTEDRGQRSEVRRQKAGGNSMTESSKYGFKTSNLFLGYSSVIEFDIEIAVKYGKFLL
jgi:hypothetical protein